MCGSHRPQWLRTGTHFYLLIHWDNAQKGLSIHTTINHPDCSPALWTWESIFCDNSRKIYFPSLFSSHYASQTTGHGPLVVLHQVYYKTTRETQHLNLIVHLIWRLGEGNAFWTSPHLKRSCHRPGKTNPTESHFSSPTILLLFFFFFNKNQSRMILHPMIMWKICYFWVTGRHNGISAQASPRGRANVEAEAAPANRQWSI